MTIKVALDSNVLVYAEGVNGQERKVAADTSATVLVEAMEITCTHRFSLWDAVMIAVAVQAGCRLLLSKDMHDGLTWRSVTVRNPFASATSTA